LGDALGCDPPLVVAGLVLFPELPGPLLRVVLSGTEKLGVEVGVDAGTLVPACVAAADTTATATCSEGVAEGVTEEEPEGLAEPPLTAENVSVVSPSGNVYLSTLPLYWTDISFETSGFKTTREICPELELEEAARLAVRRELYETVRREVELEEEPASGAPLVEKATTVRFES